MSFPLTSAQLQFNSASFASDACASSNLFSVFRLSAVCFFGLKADYAIIAGYKYIYIYICIIIVM